MQHLYRKSNAPFYEAQLSAMDVRCLECWEGVILSHVGRPVATLKAEPDLIIYDDAAAETMIIAGLACGRAAFVKNGAMSEIRTLVSDWRWADIFITTNLIYGLEILVAAQIVAYLSIPLEYRGINVYVDNSNALIALTKADSKREIILILTRLVGWGISGPKTDYALVRTGRFGL